MVIDTHIHVIVPEITLEAAPDETWRPSVTWKDGEQTVMNRGRKLGSVLRPYTDIEKILEEQVIAGVDRVLLSPWSALFRYDFEPEEGLRISRIQNESLARMAQKYTDKIHVFGTVPLQDVDLAIKELRSLMQEPGFCGVEIAASVRDVFVGDDQFRPFWAAAEETGALVFIHPTSHGLGISGLSDYYMWNCVGNPLETAVVASQMVLAGIMEEHPKLKVLLSHGGGAIASLRGRIQHAHSFQPLARKRLKESPMDSLKRFYYDTVVHDAVLLQQLIDFVGDDHVVVGSDYPFDMGYMKPAELVRSLDLPAESEERILSGNAARLIGLKQ
jgi:aminocarboxymuconate-semialdehyde decarboxylase